MIEIVYMSLYNFSKLVVDINAHKFWDIYHSDDEEEEDEEIDTERWWSDPFLDELSD
jgi:hypothetical protein